VGVAQDPEVVALARDRRVALEMCPTSNRRTNAVARLADHPALRLLEAGVSVTINTDNPGLFDVDLTHELRACREELGFSEEDVRRVTANALEASFVDEAVKADVHRRHFAWLD
jgi:adenosine deaminase